MAGKTIVKDGLRTTYGDDGSILDQSLEGYTPSEGGSFGPTSANGLRTKETKLTNDQMIERGMGTLLNTQELDKYDTGLNAAPLSSGVRSNAIDWGASQGIESPALAGSQPYLDNNSYTASNTAGASTGVREMKRGFHTDFLNSTDMPYAATLNSTTGDVYNQKTGMRYGTYGSGGQYRSLRTRTDASDVGSTNRNAISLRRNGFGS